MDSRQPLLECTLPSLPQFPYPAKKDHLFGTPKGCEGLLPRRHGVLPPQQEGLGKQLAPLQSGPSKAQPKGERPHLALESHWSCVAMVTKFLWDFFFQQWQHRKPESQAPRSPRKGAWRGRGYLPASQAVVTQRVPQPSTPFLSLAACHVPNKHPPQPISFRKRAQLRILQDFTSPPRVYPVVKTVPFLPRMGISWTSHKAQPHPLLLSQPP